MSSDRVHRYTLDDDLEEAAEKVSRELPEQIARVRAHIREARRKLSADEDDSAVPSGGD